MSLIHRRKSIIFNNPETTSSKVKIQQILEAHKLKLQINNRSSSRPKVNQKQRLSLGQAVKLQQLHSKVSKERRLSLNSLFMGFDHNCMDNVEEERRNIDDQKMGLFRRGVYYRSSERAKGAGVRKCSQEELKEYFNCEDSFNSQKKAKIVIPSIERKLKEYELASTKAVSFKSR